MRHEITCEKPLRDFDPIGVPIVPLAHRRFGILTPASPRSFRRLSNKAAKKVAHRRLPALKISADRLSLVSEHLKNDLDG